MCLTSYWPIMFSIRVIWIRWYWITNNIIWWDQRTNFQIKFVQKTMWYFRSTLPFSKVVLNTIPQPYPSLKTHHMIDKTSINNLDSIMILDIDIYVIFFLGNPAALGTWLYRVDTCTSTHVNYPQLCYDWSITVAQQELNTSISYDNILTNCPCNLKQAQNDPQFYQEEGSSCFYTQYAPLVTTGARVSTCRK